MKKTFITTAIISMAFMTIGCTEKAETAPLESLTSSVNPFIGTGGHGHVFLGANAPFGFVQLGPTQVVKGWDWCSGYHYSDSLLTGFSHTRLSGTGIGELGDLLLTPVTHFRQRLVPFTHEEETCRPGYYSVQLHQPEVKVELTATQRAGFHRYQFDAQADSAFIRMDLLQGVGWDRLKDCQWTLENDTTISGHRFSGGWAKNQKFFFTMKFSRPITSVTHANDSIALLSFAQPSEPILIKVGTSAVSIDGAKMNLKHEIKDWDFDKVAQKTDKLWNKELNRMHIRTNDEVAKTIFYTSLYHTMIAPSVYCDVNGDYRGSDDQVYRQPDFVNYTTFSLWDTYRAAHPLYTLMYPEKMRDFAETFLRIYEQQGKLPVWHLMGNENNCMVGSPALPVLSDIILKGTKGIDAVYALQAMRASELLDVRGLEHIKKYGYIPYDETDGSGSVSKALEYALADASAAQVAKMLNREDDYQFFQKRAEAYKQYFDPSTGFFRALSKEKKFREPFDPLLSIHAKGDYTEGNAWQYAFLVPHDVHGLVGLHGSEERFIAKLDSLFHIEGDMGAEASPDISGLIGQYAQGNEPSHHVLYLYNYVGQPWKAAPWLRHIMHTLYKADPDGLCGNEDVGQMSAWYVLSSMGLYQVEPAGGKFVFGSPLFDEVTLQVKDKQSFRIVAHHNSKENMYIQSVKLNGQPYHRSYIEYADIMKGGVLEFEMGNAPSNTFGVSPDTRP